MTFHDPVYETMSVRVERVGDQIVRVDLSRAADQALEGVDAVVRVTRPHRRAVEEVELSIDIARRYARLEHATREDLGIAGRELREQARLLLAADRAIHVGRLARDVEQTHDGPQLAAHALGNAQKRLLPR